MIRLYAVIEDANRNSFAGITATPSFFHIHVKTTVATFVLHNKHKSSDNEKADVFLGVNKTNSIFIVYFILLNGILSQISLVSTNN